MATTSSPNHWMPSRLLYERGVDFRRVEDGYWETVAADGNPIRVASADQAIIEKAGIRPIVISEHFAPNSEIWHILSRDGRKLYDPGFWRFQSHGKTFEASWALEYPFEAFHYHVVQLALRYSVVVSRYATDIQRGFPSEPRANFGSRDTLWTYFEFDAAISEARRTYDALKHLIWCTYGPIEKNSQTTDNTFKQVLSQCASLPEELRTTLTTSWANTGVKLAEYRNCIQHHVPIDFGIAYANMELLDNRIWTTRFLIPDNPEARSKFAFRFSSYCDALTYVWDVYNELHVILESALAIMGSDLDAGAHTGTDS